MGEYVSAQMKRLNYLTSEIDGVYHKAALKLGLSDSEMMILYSICNEGDSCLLHDICKFSGASRQTINSGLRKLEKAGRVSLEACGGRKKRVCLTKQGRELVQNTVVRVIQAENDILNSWPEEEREAYLELTKRYLEALRNKVNAI
ncbi:MAG: MarR family transcriptional regulator [Acetatifactor sp.]|nr:MarR family transcriptional regulator [Acetatifactor sp.]MDE7354052.1 MarR family transcriptional regulator [Acetatifactor sp.]